MATRRNLHSKTYASAYVAVAKLARWLCNDLAGETGPGWKIVAAYDASLDSRRIPTGGAGVDDDMDNAALDDGTFSWQAGEDDPPVAIAAGDWIVLQSAHVSNPFQLLIKVVDSNTIQFSLMVDADFDVAGASKSNPTLPTTVMTTNFDWSATPARYTVVADEEMAAILFDDDVTPAWLYVGQLDGARSFMTPADTKPYVISRTTTCFHHVGVTTFSRRSPIDGTEIIGTSAMPSAYSSSGSVGSPHYAANGDGLGGAYCMLPVGVYFWRTAAVNSDAAAHMHFAGWLRYVGSTHKSLSIGTLGAGNEVVVRNSNAGIYAAVAFLGNGSAYP